MPLQKKIQMLDKIYTVFDSETRAYRTDQACQKACAFCCSEAGSIDITTLEGLRIQNTIKTFTKPRQTALAKALGRDMKKRENNQISACPFLMKNQACMIYAVRPFACRRIYSNHTCTRQAPPAVSRRVMDRAKDTIRELQQLDGTGYSGHMSYLLHMLDTPAFSDTYLNGGFKPHEIMVFGKSHRISINQMMVSSCIDGADR